jgi:hypothetical protein
LGHKFAARIANLKKIFKKLDAAAYERDNEDLAASADNEMTGAEDEQRLTEDLPFMAAHQERNFGMRGGLGGNNKPLIDAFFKEEAKDVDDFYNMSDEDNRSCKYLHFFILLHI